MQMRNQQASRHLPPPSSHSNMIMESYDHHPSIHEYLLGLIGNAGCNELVLVRDDPGYAPQDDSAPSVVLDTTTMRIRAKSQEGRGGGRKKEENATLAWSRTKERSSNDGHLVQCDGEGDSTWNQDGSCCWCECTMSMERIMCEGCEQSIVNDRVHPLASRKKLAPVPPPPPILPCGERSPSPSMGASPNSVLFHPNNARRRRPCLRRIERATTIPTTRFDLRRDLRCDYYNRSPQSELKIDGPPCRPQRRPSIRNLD